MGFFGGQFQSVIEWKDPSPDILIWKWEGNTDELKNASKLIINQGQAAFFLYGGQIKAYHDYPGVFELHTANLPFWTTLTKIMQGFESEHKGGIYFIRLTEFTNQKWGTKAPIKYEDPKYKIPVGLRAFGNFSMRIVEPRKFFTEFSSSRSIVSINEVRNTIVDRIITPLTDLLAESGISYAEIDKQRVELSEKLQKTVSIMFAAIGFEMTDFRIENTDFDDETKKRIDKIADRLIDVQSMKAFADIDQASLQNYAKIEQLKAMNNAATNPGGGSGDMINMAAGLAMAQNMTGMFNPNNKTSQPQDAANLIKCSNCNAKAPATAKFCPECGKPPVSSAACVQCKASITSGAKFCPECGAPQKSACPRCNANLSAGAKFCPECGNKI